jgi:hypothetical protein
LVPRGGVDVMKKRKALEPAGKFIPAEYIE